MKRVVDTAVHLEKQGLAFRGHRESLIDDPEVNKGNFLESLNYLSAYDVTTVAKLCYKTNSLIVQSNYLTVLFR